MLQYVCVYLRACSALQVCESVNWGHWCLCSVIVGQLDNKPRGKGRWLAQIKTEWIEHWGSVCLSASRAGQAAVLSDVSAELLYKRTR